MNAKFQRCDAKGPRDIAMGPCTREKGHGSSHADAYNNMWYDGETKAERVRQERINRLIRIRDEAEAALLDAACETGLASAVYEHNVVRCAVDFARARKCLLAAEKTL